MSRRLGASLVLGCLLCGTARADDAVAVGYVDALARARASSPELVAARSREPMAKADIGIAGTYPNPSVYAGTSTQAARLGVGASIPLVVFGQRGAAIDASRADYETVRADTGLVWNDVRAATARAYVSLWLAERTAGARGDAAVVVKRLEDAVRGRIDVGVAPEVEGLRVRAERLRADADAAEAVALVSAAGSDLARWIGVPDGAMLRAKDDPPAPASPPPLASLLERVEQAPAVKRDKADERASDARAHRERALVRPLLTLDVGADIADPSYAGPNYRAQVGIEVPIFNQRGAYIEREVHAAEAARARASASRARGTADVTIAYRTFVAISARMKALEEGVVPAAEAAASSTEEAYALGHSPLIAVLDATKARIEARLSLLDARAARALAWVDVERAVGAP